MKKEKGFRATSYAALALAFASLGDAFLYPFLPVNSGELGIPVVWVGVLLSINRFVRIISNTLMVHALAMYGLRMLMIVAAVLAVTSTAGYGIATELVAWLSCRIMWGLSFSAMRIGTLGYALQQDQQGFALGMSRGIQEAGPLLSLFMAPVLLMYFDSRTIFYLLALLSLPALLFAWQLPVPADKPKAFERKLFLHWPSSLNALTFISAILIDGILIVVLGILFLRYQDAISLVQATTMAAFYLGYRRVCLVVLSPAGGWISDRIGLERVFNVSMVFMLTGLVAIVSGWIGTGAVIVFTFYSINAAVTPGYASKTNVNSLAAVAENVTWRDIGAAIGTLCGGLLILSPYLNPVMIMIIFALAFILLIHFGTARKALKILHAWK